MTEQVPTVRIGEAVIIELHRVLGYPMRLRDILAEIGTTEAKTVVLDLSEVPTVGSVGLGVLLRFLQRTKARGIALRLANVQPDLRERLEITKLTLLFAIHADVAAALAAGTE